ncbi:RrF2 family transcriptional regulator [Amycolatopsis vastitatis]|uniref:Transcriptional regulator n=1 Tax=Amycolatopsis vastitatis TaxID=1905142 RepID=A0A229SKN9_9PSEU|nr:Rrf2 family transcriptional regulator [Amycolatopsis vastitatis]OXM59340.1 transcriptional regulator [Amycolatopsis vastitatis]
MRVTAKVEYAIRACVQLAADEDDGSATAAQLADKQGIPHKFLHAVLTDLKRARLVHSVRGPDGGYTLARPATAISIADIFRAIDGPMLTVRDQGLSDLHYTGPAGPLLELWMATRTSLRDVFEKTTLADVVANDLPAAVTELASRYREDRRHP